MKSFVAAVVVALVLAVGSAGMLEQVQQVVGHAYATGGVRLDAGE
jgi:hypothetical protein